ncbi:MAG: terminase family protein [Alphaproteobacteria bacterium]
MTRTASATSLRNALRDWGANSTVADAFSRSLSAAEAIDLAYNWEVWARDDQLPPDVAPNGQPWTTWLVLGGRGAGKTRTGAEWVRGLALGLAPFASCPVEHIALIGETLGDARAVMVDGPSGLLAIHPPAERPTFNASRRELLWPNGAVARIFSADDPESLRGPQFGAAWADELAKWRYAERTWDMLQFCLRLGERPRQVVTTTPRPIPLLKRLIADPATAISRAATSANAANLAPSFLSAVVGRYQGTRLGRQELDGDLIEDRADALWRRDQIERARIDRASVCSARSDKHRSPALTRIVVAIDPPVTSGARADACGIVAAGRGEDGRACVLADATVQGVTALEWARAAVRLYESLAADCIVAEVNQGGELVAEMLRQVSPGVPVRMVRASRGKFTRAEPVAALYERGLVSHAGVWPELEDQMCDFGPGGLSGGGSPDRVDALVWALTELMLGGEDAPAEPRIRTM